MATQIYNNSKQLGYSANSSTGYTYTFALKLTRDTQNVTSNYTPTTAICSLTSPASRWATSNSYGQLSVTLYWIKADGTYGSKTVTGDKINNSAYNTTYLVSVSQNVPHLDDGTSKVYAIGKWYSSASNSYRPASSSLTSSKIDLPTIPRASEITATSGYIGETISIYINRKSALFRETLTWSCGDLNGTIPNESNATTVPFTIPTSLYALIPNNKSIVITITAVTYNESILVGTKNTTLTARVDEISNKPVIEEIVITETNERVSALTDKLVLNASKPKITITTEAKNSATIKDIVTTNEDGQSLNGQEVTFNEIGTAKFNITATDSRTLVTTEIIDKSLTAIPYTKPNIKTVSIERKTPISGEIILNASGLYYSGIIDATTNELFISYRYKENSSDATWSNLFDVPNEAISFNFDNNTYEIYDYNLGEITEYNKNYVFEVYCSDILTTIDIPIKRIVKKGIDVFSLGEHDAKVNGNLFVADEDGQGKINILEKINKNSMYKNILTIGLSTNNNYTVSSTWTDYVAPVDEEKNSVGNKLTFENGGIKIGKDLSKIMVNANVLLRGIVGTLYVSVLKNGVPCSSAYYQCTNVNTWESRTISPILIDVEENDLITLGYGAGATGTIQFGGNPLTYLTVVVID